MSRTEQDLETSTADDAVDALVDEADSATGPATGELEALDSIFVDSLDDEVGEGDDVADEVDITGELATAADFEAAEHAAEILGAADQSEASGDDVEAQVDAGTGQLDDVEVDVPAPADDAVVESSDVDAVRSDGDVDAAVVAVVDDIEVAEPVAPEEATTDGSPVAAAADSDAAADVTVEEADTDGATNSTETSSSTETIEPTAIIEQAADQAIEQPETAADQAIEQAADEAIGSVAAAESTDAKEGEGAGAPAASPGILEELRRANIDGPVVDLAPQDDTTGGTRRPPKRPLDYDPAPVPVPLKVPRILGRKPRVRKVTRVVRHVDPWSVFKIGLLANLVLYAIVLTAGVLLWNVAYATGTIENVERFFESFGWQSFEFNGGELYNAAWIAGLFLVIGLTGLWVLLATLFNLITDVVGGVRFTVLEEEVVEARSSPMRRFVVRRTEPEIPATSADASGQVAREVVVDDSGAIDRPSDA